MNPTPRPGRGEILPLCLALFATLGLGGGLAGLGLNQLRSKAEFSESGPLFGGLVRDQAQLVSTGDRNLFPNEGGDRAPAVFLQHKTDGVTAFNQGDYFEAALNWKSALGVYANAPETLIYLNNARIGPRKAMEVAIALPISGSNPNNALEMLRGFAQLQEELNASGGINGLPLRLHLADDGDDPERAVELARQFAQQPEIKAVLGHWTSDVSLAAAAVYNQAQLPFVTPISTTNELSSAGPYSFRTALTNASGGQRLATHALQAWRLRKVAIFYAQGVTYSEEIRQQFSQTLTAAGGEVIGKFDLTSGDFQARQSVEQAISAGAELLLVIPNNATMERSLQVIQANQGRLKLLGDLANLYNPKTLDLGPNAEGLVMALSWSIDQPSAAAFAQRSRHLWQADVNYASANAYDALKAVTDAMAQAEDREGIATVLRRQDFSSQGAAGRVSFQPSGDRLLTPLLVEIRPVKSSRSGTGYDFMAIAE